MREGKSSVSHDTVPNLNSKVSVRDGQVVEQTRTVC